LDSFFTAATPRLINSRAAAARLGIRVWNRKSSMAESSSADNRSWTRSVRFGLVGGIDVDGFAREDFEEAIKALEERGLDQVAKVMRDLAAEYPSGLDLNPYDPKDRNNWLMWRRSWFNRRRMDTERKLRDARQAKC
jgi:hypothetical protein